MRTRGVVWLLALVLLAALALLGTRMIRLLTFAIEMTQFGFRVLVILGFVAFFLYIIKMSSKKS